jgi:hypothetical protein
MELLPAVVSTAWASGVNAYLVVFVLGSLGRFAGVSEVPELLQRTDVLLVSGLLLAVEIVVDKIPYIDTAWDGLSTLVRPAVGAGLAMLLLDEPTGAAPLVATLGGALALASHAVKSGVRLMVNSSPEPFSNIAVSSVEDLTVLVVLLLVVSFPWWALGISMGCFALGLAVVLTTFAHLVRARHS